MPGQSSNVSSTDILRVLVEGTAAATGDDFFRSLARHAAQALGARYAFAAETLSEMESRSLAYWEGSGFGEGFSYRFLGTPCLRYGLPNHLIHLGPDRFDWSFADEAMAEIRRLGITPILTTFAARVTLPLVRRPDSPRSAAQRRRRLSTAMGRAVRNRP